MPSNLFCLVSRSRLSPIVLATFAAMVLVAGTSVHGQTINPVSAIDNTTSTPVPGVPHDYIQSLNETVNPANGALSIRIKAPTPHERGVNWPHYVFMYDSNQQYQLVPTWAAWSSGSVTGQNLNYLNFLEPTSPMMGGQTIPSLTTLPSGNGQTTTYACTITTGYMFTDPDGGLHTLALSVATPTPENGSVVSSCTPFPATNVFAGGDIQYKAYIPNPTTAPNTVVVVDTHGDEIVTTATVGNVLIESGTEDVNGNQITPLPTGTASPTGRKFLTTGQATPNNSTTMTLPGVSGDYQLAWIAPVAPSFTLNFAPVSGVTGCDLTSITAAGSSGSGISGPAGNEARVSTVTLPDGLSYEFSYDPVYGLLNKIVYPTGAWVEYTWGINPAAEGNAWPVVGTSTTQCELIHDWFAITKRVVSHDGTNADEEQDFSYSTVWPGGSSSPTSTFWTSKTTTVTTKDLLRGTSFQTIYTYNPMLAPPTQPFEGAAVRGVVPVENTITYKDTSGAPIKTITKTWQSMSLMSGECETLPNGKMSGKFYTYQPYTGFSRLVGLGSLNAPVNPEANWTNLPTDVAEYDYGKITTCANPTGSIPSTTALRETVTSYTTFGTSPFFPWIPPSSGTPSSSILLDHPAAVQVYGNGTLLSQTDYVYDGASLGGTITGTVYGFDYPNFDSSANPPRGNLTSIQKCTAISGNACSAFGVNSSFTYDFTGQVVSATDPCGNTSCSDMVGSGHTTTYLYADAYTNGTPPAGYVTNAYPTTIKAPTTGPYSHTTTYQFGYADGRLWSATDVENVTTTNYCYLTGSSCSGSPDPYYRLTGVHHPDGGQETVTYFDGSPSASPTVTVSTLLATGSSVTKESIYDAFGLETTSLLKSDPDGTDEVDTTYDGLGQVWTKTNPYRSSVAFPTNGTSTFYYDALGRQVEEQEPDGNILQTCYNGTPSVPAVANCNSQVGGVTTGNWVDSTDESDNHWQRTSNALGQLMDVMEPNGATQSPTMETDYTYDAQSNLLTVKQCGALCSAPVANAPGTRSFSYDPLSRLSSTANPETGTVTYTYDANGNVATKKDARSVTISYIYDNLNRLFAKSYSSGDPSVFTQYDIAGSAADPYPHGRMTLEWTGPASGAPSSSTSTGSIPSTAYNSTVIIQHDPMGRVLSEEQNPYGPSGLNYQFLYNYDLAGDVTCANNGLGTVSASNTCNGQTTSTNDGIVEKFTYDTAQRLASATTAVQPWTASSTFPNTLLQTVNATTTAASYDPMMHLVNAQLSIFGTAAATITEARQYDNRGRITQEFDTGAAGSSAASHSIGTIAIAGSEQGPVYPASSYAKATITIGGTERDNTFNVCPNNPHGPCEQQVPDGGNVTIVIDGTTLTTAYSLNSTDTTIASLLAADINNAGLPLTATASAGVITIKSTVSGTGANSIPLSASSVTTTTLYYTSSSFTATASGSTLSGGANVPQNVYDSGTITAKVNGITASVNYSNTGNNNGTTIASALASAIQAADSSVTAKADGDVNVLISTSTGSATDYSVTVSTTYDSADFSAPSFLPTAFPMADGGAADSTNGLIYSYYIPGNGYAPNGNLLASSDSVMGDWVFGYDTLNRVTSGASITGTINGLYAGYVGCWGYDGFGNRTMEGISPSASSPCTTPANDSVQLTSRSFNSLNQDTGFNYDLAGNVHIDNENTYLYDGEGRLCAVNSTIAGSATLTQYVYNAEGLRVAKGSLASWPSSCNAPTSANGFTPTNQYLTDLGGNQVTELSGTGSQVHSNVFAGSNLLATYDFGSTATLHFALTDPLGTRRVQVAPSGATELYCISLPFGNNVGNLRTTNCTPGNAPAADATEHHFTGKERDTESGNDYFGARYYSSAVGRFMSPDPKIGSAHAASPQSWNRYGYALGNPLKFNDPDGKEAIIFYRPPDPNQSSTKDFGHVFLFVRNDKTGRAGFFDYYPDPGKSAVHRSVQASRIASHAALVIDSTPEAEDRMLNKMDELTKKNPPFNAGSGGWLTALWNAFTGKANDCVTMSEQILGAGGIQDSSSSPTGLWDDLYAQFSDDDTVGSDLGSQGMHDPKMGSRYGGNKVGARSVLDVMSDAADEAKRQAEEAEEKHKKEQTQ